MANSLNGLVYTIGNCLLYIPRLTGASGKGRPIWNDDDPDAKTRERRKNLRDRERENRLSNPFSYTGLTIRFIALCLILAVSAIIQVRYSLDFTSLSVLRPWFLAYTGINDQTREDDVSLIFLFVCVVSFLVPPLIVQVSRRPWVMNVFIFSSTLYMGALLGIVAANPLLSRYGVPGGGPAPSPLDRFYLHPWYAIYPRYILLVVILVWCLAEFLLIRVATHDRDAGIMIFMVQCLYLLSLVVFVFIFGRRSEASLAGMVVLCIGAAMLPIDASKAVDMVGQRRHGGWQWLAVWVIILELSMVALSSTSLFFAKVAS